MAFEFLKEQSARRRGETGTDWVKDGAPGNQADIPVWRLFYPAVWVPDNEARYFTFFHCPHVQTFLPRELCEYCQKRY